MIADEDQLRTIWSNPDNREHFLTQLDDHGYDPDRLDDIRRLVDARKSDLYDVLSYILFANPPKTRHDRAETVRQDGMGVFAGEMKELLLGILNAYETAGEAELGGKKLGQFLTARYGSVSEGRAMLGDLQVIREAYNRMQAELYAE
jgi:type I restriction enzyme, R subunit